MPGTFVKMKCPKCGDEFKLEMIDQIYYPCIDEEHNFYGKCLNCVTDWEVSYQIEVFAKITI